MHWTYGGGMGAGGWVIMSIAWIALVLLIVWAASRLLPRRDVPQATGVAGSSTPPAADPLAILDTRLARGEIDLDTHDRLRERLSGGSSAGGK